MKDKNQTLFGDDHIYRIALCDGTIPELKNTERLLNIYKAVHPEYDFTVQQFTAIEPLLSAIEQGTGYDILLLDLSMAEKTVDVFDPDAVLYLPKPVDQAHFFAAMDKALYRAEQERRCYIVLRLDGILQRIALRDIVFCESHGNYQYLTLVDGTELRVRITLTKLHTLMSDSTYFVPVGIAYLVNLIHVKTLSAKEILLDNNRRIGVPRGAFPAIKMRYSDFYCSGKEGQTDESRAN